MDDKSARKKRKHAEFVNSAVEYQLDADRDDMLVSDISRVLIIYTGGTIGMKNTEDHGYVPVANYLAQSLAKMNRFHDGEFADSYRSVSMSRRQSIVEEDGRNNDQDTKSPPVDGSRSKNTKYKDNRLKITASHAKRAADSGSSSQTPDSEEIPSAAVANHHRQLSNFEQELAHALTLQAEEGTVITIPSLITPPSLYKKRIQYSVLEYTPLLDSCNMTMSDWIRIATDVEANYEFYDAFVILHGTDTMAYTASALSFMLEELGKTVIVTGSQVPITELRNDAVENLLGALTIAGHFVIPEVGLYFSQKLFRGNRTSKMNAVDFDAFDSPNMRPLVVMGINIDVAWTEVIRPTHIAKFSAHKRMNPNVATLRLFPGITNTTVRAFLAPPIQGVVLETYGAGNAPSTRIDLMDALKEASDRGVVIVNCTQCKKGLVTDAYATGRVLAKAGVTPGADMTPECALTKLSYLLSKPYTVNQIRSLMKRNLRGELTVPAPRPRFTVHNRMHNLIQMLVRLSSATSTSLPPSSDVPVQDASVPKQERILLEKTLYPMLICSAAGTNDMESLYLLYDNLGDTMNVNCVDYDGRTPLHVACSEGHTQVVEFLLLHGASVHVRDRYGRTPLHDAIRERHGPVIQLLRQTGAHLSEGEINTVGELWLRAVRANDVDAVRMYIIAGWDVTWREDGCEARNAAWVAVREGHWRVLEVLCKEGGLTAKAIGTDRDGRQLSQEIERMARVANGEVGWGLLDPDRTPSATSIQEMQRIVKENHL